MQSMVYLLVTSTTTNTEGVQNHSHIIIKIDYQLTPYIPKWSMIYSAILPGTVEPFHWYTFSAQ